MIRFSNTVETIRQSSPGGGFVKKEGNMWYEAGDHLAREVSADKLLFAVLKEENIGIHLRWLCRAFWMSLESRSMFTRHAA